MTKLTTHVLDIHSGKPGAGIKVELYYFNNNKREKKKTLTLNEDGRADKPLLEGQDFLNGTILSRPHTQNFNTVTLFE